MAIKNDEEDRVVAVVVMNDARESRWCGSRPQPMEIYNSWIPARRKNGRSGEEKKNGRKGDR